MKPNKINLDSTGLDNKQLRTLAKNLNLDSSGAIPEVKVRIDHYLKHLPEDVKKFLEEFDQMKEKDKKMWVAQHKPKLLLKPEEKETSIIPVTAKVEN